VLQERRRILHEQTAQAIEALYSASLEDHYSDLAHHYSRSGNTQKAIDYLQLAGQQAARRSANAEAVIHLTAALELLKTLPETLDRDQKELTLQITLGAPLAITKGNAAPEVERAYARARELCRQVGETPQLFPALFGLWYFYLMRVQLKAAHELAEQLFSLAKNIQDPALLLEAHYAVGATLWVLGEFVSAREHFEQSIALYNPQQHHSLAFIYGEQDPGVICRADAAQVLWLLGYPDQALKMSHNALTLARELAHPFSLVWALYTAASLHMRQREWKAAQEWVEAALAVCTEHELAQWSAWVAIHQGWALTMEGQGEEGIAQIRRSLAAYRATGAEGGDPYLLALLAEAYGEVKQTEEGLNTLAEVLGVADRTEEYLWEAELYRLKGQLTLQSSVQRLASSVANLQSLTPNPQAEAEECFLKAIEIARRQQAKSLELRAVTSLSRLWQQRGGKEQARQLLAETYGWFTEGFDTADLKDAKALLDELEKV
jgi:predicted ATPase